MKKVSEYISIEKDIIKYILFNDFTFKNRDANFNQLFNCLFNVEWKINCVGTPFTNLWTTLMYICSNR